MKSIARVLVAASLAACLSSHCSARDSSRDDFVEFCQAWEGRWAGEITWVDDWPTFGKKGDTTTCHVEFRMIDDGNALLGKFYGGIGSATILWTYDPAGKAIVGMVTFSGGSLNRSRYYKQDGVWIEEVTGCLADGKVTKHRSEIRFTEKDGKRLVRLEGTGTVDGKATDPRDDTYYFLGK